MTPADTLLRYGNLALLILFPIAWTAPLLRAGILPLFRLSEITVVSGFTALIEVDLFLAALVFFFAFLAPYAKTLMLAAIQFGYASPRWLPFLTWLGKLAMADVFLIALYIVVIKGIGVGRVETGWGLYLFTACVLWSLLLSLLTMRALTAREAVGKGGALGQ